jgi:hypothetical protein
MFDWKSHYGRAALAKARLFLPSTYISQISQLLTVIGHFVIRSRRAGVIPH